MNGQYSSTEALHQVLMEGRQKFSGWKKSGTTVQMK